MSGRRSKLLSWTVRYRSLPSLLWFFIPMIKLCKPRSLQYRRQILQETIRWKALDEIYKIYMLLHRSDLNISENFRETFYHFSENFENFTHWIFSKTSHWILLRVWWNVGISQILIFPKMFKNIIHQNTTGRHKPNWGPTWARFRAWVSPRSRLLWRCRRRTAT